MTAKEAIQAAEQRVPVVCNEITYSRIRAIIWRYNDNGKLICAEMEDMNGAKSVTEAPIEKICLLQ